MDVLKKQKNILLCIKYWQFELQLRRAEQKREEAEARARELEKQVKKLN